MALTVTTTPGKTFTASETITIAKLNQLGQPTFAITGTVAAGDLAANAVTSAASVPGPYFYAAGTLSGGVYTVTLSPAATSYAAGLIIHFLAGSANTGAADVNVNSLGAKNLFKEGGAELAANDIRASQWVTACYNGTDFIVTSPLGNRQIDYIADTGSANAVLVAPQMQGAAAYTAYSQLVGRPLLVKMAATNTSASTINVNGIGAKSIKTTAGAALAAGDLVINTNALLTYNATSDVFELANPAAASASLVVGEDAGGTDAYALTGSPAPSAYTTGLVVAFKAATANTGACSLNVNSLGAKTLKKRVSVDMQNGDILASQWVVAVYDGTNFQISGPANGPTTMYSATDSVTVPTASGATNFGHGLGAVPRSARVVLINTSTELGYSVDDEVDAMSANESGFYSIPFSVARDATNLTVTYTAPSACTVQHKTTGVRTAITNSKWKLKVYAEL